MQQEGAESAEVGTTTNSASSAISCSTGLLMVRDRAGNGLPSEFRIMASIG